MFLEMLKAFFFGLVEGITEWLPVSSTGHLVLFNNFITMDVSAEFMEMFTVVIQLGAIMAVIILYFSKLNPFSRKKTPQQRKGTWSLWGKVVVGCIPAAIVGVALDDWADAHLYNAVVIAGALILYGVIFIVIERLNKRQGAHTRRRVQEVEELDLLTAFKIGCFQCLALFPGFSRSAATIMGGMILGARRPLAAEYSFIAAVPIMVAATGFDLLKSLHLFTAADIPFFAVGMIGSFISALIAVKAFVRLVGHMTLVPFAVYRLLLAPFIWYFMVH